MEYKTEDGKVLKGFSQVDLDELKNNIVENTREIIKLRSTNNRLFWLILIGGIIGAAIILYKFEEISKLALAIWKLSLKG